MNPDHPERESTDDQSVDWGGVLWIDGVGGYRIVTGDRLTIGRQDCTVNLVAAVSRCCGSLVRRGEDWFWNAGNAAIGRVEADSNGERWMGDGQTLPIQGGIEIRFFRPSPLSATRVLKIQSGQRWDGAVDAVILAAGVVSIGPGPMDHVFAKDFSETAVLRFGDAAHRGDVGPAEVTVRQGDRHFQLVAGEAAELEGFHILFQRDDRLPKSSS